VLAYIRNLLA